MTGFTFSSSASGVAEVNGNQLTFISPGMSIITATQAGDANYAAGSDSIEITVNKGIQVVTFTLSETTYKVGDAAITLSASTDISVLTGFTFSSSDTSVAEVNGNELSFISPGTAKIIATQAGDANYVAGSDSVDITVNKGIQVVSFALSKTIYKVGSAAVILSASTDATGLTGFTFSSSDTGVAAVNGNELTFVSPGTAKIIATQAGDANYVASSDSIEITVNKGMQVVTFALSKTIYKVGSAAVILSASTDATGLTGFTFSSSDPGVAAISGNELSFISPGTAKITATQAGNVNYAAGSESVDITVNKGGQVVTFTLSKTTYKIGDTAITLSASTDATGLTGFTFSSSTPGVVEVTGNQLTFVSPGTVKIIATQAGDANYVSGSDSVDITVNKGGQVVTFTLSKTTYKIGDTAITLSASTDATGLTNFTFSSSAPGVAVVSGDRLTFVSPGTAKIIATQAGDANYVSGSDSIEITVNKGMQVVTFTLSKTTYKVGAAAVTLSASTDAAGLTDFTFSSSTPGVAAVSGDQLTFVSPGTAKITAAQAGNADYAAGSESVDITVTDKQIQTITFTLSKTTYKVGAVAVTLSASTDAAGLTGFTFSSSDTGVAAVNGNELTFVSVGTAKITATQAGNADYAVGSESVDIMVTDKQIQTITFTLLKTTYKIGDAAITLSASTDAAGLTDFTFSSSAPGVAAVTGNQLTFVSPGTAKIIATQAGNADYAAGSESVDITVTDKQIQTITFILSETTYKIGDTAITLSASTDATGLTDFTFISSDPGVAEVTGNQLTFISAGTAKITATQAGNVNYAAGSESVDIMVTDKQIQTITFTLSKTTYKIGDTAITLSASTDATGLTDFTFISSDPGVAAVNGNELTFVSVGTAKITATQAGNADYAAGSESVDIMVTDKQIQTITFILSETTYKIGDTAITLSASTDATGLTDFTFISSDPGVAAVNGNELTFVSVGTAKITATQAGNADYAAGSESVDIMVTDKQIQTITFILSETTYKIGDTAITLSASTDATGLTDFTFISSDPGVAEVTGNQLTFISAGTAKITATQAGNVNYAAGSESVDIMVTDKQIQTITFTLLKTTYKVGNAAITLSASTDATGLTGFTFSSSDPGVAEVTGNQLTFISAGTAKITATQAGNVNYAAGSESVDITVTVIESILGTSSIEEGAVLYPNPTSGVLYLDMEADEVRVYDIRGRLLKELFGMVRSVDFDHGMGVAGQYIVEVVLNGRSTRYLIIKE